VAASITSGKPVAADKFHPRSLYVRHPVSKSIGPRAHELTAKSVVSWSDGGRGVGNFMRRLIGTPTGGWATPRSAATTVLVTGWVACLVLNWPGQLSYDSIAQLHDGRFGVYNDWHPPVMAWMLGLADSIVPGAGVFVVFDTVLFFGAFLSLLRLSPRPSWLAAIAAIVFVFLPQFLLFQGIVWKDVLFADSALAGFVLIAHADAQWPNRRLRYALLCAAIVLLVLATLARQNGAIVLVFGVAAIGTLAAARASPSLRLRSAAISVAITSVGALGLMLAASAALAMRTPGESGPRAQFKLLETYDLAGAAKADPHLPLDTLAAANPDFERLLRTDGAKLYTPQRNDTLAASAALQDELSDTSNDAVAAQWRGLVVHHPWLYLSIRARVFDWTFFTPEISRCAPLFVGVEGLPRYMHDLNLSARFRPQDVALKNYGAIFLDTPAMSHAAFGLLGLGILLVLLRRRATSDIVIAFMLLSAFAFTLSFFVISIACDYRYLLFLDFSALAGAFHLAVSRRKSA
jgi:hypothetical protein